MQVSWGQAPEKERAVAAPDQDLRASDAEREQVIDDLRQHAADGRLTMDEFEQRVTEALAARTRADLGPVLRELPPIDHARQGGRRPQRRLPLPDGRTLVTAAVVVFALVMVTQGMWWIIFPLLGIFGGCGRGRRTRACGMGGGWYDSARPTHGHHRGRHGGDRHDPRGGQPDDRELIRL